MTTVTFFRENGKYLGFRASGHTGNAAAGEDIVCAAVSAAVGLAECEITDILGLSAKIVTNEDCPEVLLRFNNPEKGAQPVLRALLLYLTRLAGEYPSFIKIEEE